jgi:PAS domain S-box-containing protein
VHSTVIAIKQDEKQFLSKRKAENEQIIANSSRLLKFLQFLGVLLILIVLKIIYDNVRLRSKMEEALQKSLKDLSDYKYALDESSIVGITSQKGIIKQVNDNFCKMSKYKKEELIGMDHRIINSGNYSKEFIRNLWVTIVNGKVWRGELKNVDKEGTFYWTDTTIVPFLNEQHKPYQYVAICSEIYSASLNKFRSSIINAFKTLCLK